MLQQLMRKARGGVQKFGPSLAKRWLWDHEFASGARHNLDGAPQYAHPEVQQYAKGGNVLDLGCGPGRTGLELIPGTFAQYLGVDISQVAVDRARTAAAHRHDLAYAQGDLMTFIAPNVYSVVMLGDSIYYVPLTKIASLFAHYTPALDHDGVFLVRVCDPEGRYQPILSACREACTVISDTRLINEEAVPVHTLVLRPH